MPALAACGGGDLVLPNEGQPAEVTVVSGDEQTGTILEALEDSLVVKVSDRFGNPVGGVEVSWSAVDGGEVRPATAVTSGNGMAATQRVLGAQPGSYATSAVATVLPDDGVSFTTTAVSAKLVLTTEPPATAASGVPLDPQPVLQLQDLAGTPLAREGVSVTVQIASGPGSLSGTTSRLTDAAGNVAFTDLTIAGAPGARTLIFASSGYAPATSTPISIGVGAPASVTASAGTGQTAPAGTAVPVRPAVLVRDAGGTPVAGVGVAFVVTAGGGKVTGGAATTGTDGVAAVGSWTLGNSAGSNTLQATVSADGVTGNPVAFTATAVAGPASADQSSVTAAPGSISASQGSDAATITIIVRDANGIALAGQSVSLTATGAGVTLTQPGPTNSSGTTTGKLSATVAGPHVVTALTAGVTLGSATVTVTPGAPSPARTTVTVPDGVAGTPTTIQIALQDEFGNALAGGAGQIRVSVSGANTVNDARVDDAGGGSYTAAYTPDRTGTDQVSVTVAAQAVAGSPFTSAVAAGAADARRTTADVPKDVGLFNPSENPVHISVHTFDAKNNPLGRGGDQVVITVRLDNDLVATPTVTDVGDGSYTATWTVQSPANNYRVSITLNGTEIDHSPFSVKVTLF
ncbi:MAG: invasin domain 3-containing protein [Gemmatimonadales bacterium]